MIASMEAMEPQKSVAKACAIPINLRQQIFQSLQPLSELSELSDQMNLKVQINQMIVPKRVPQSATQASLIAFTINETLPNCLGW